MEGKSPAQIIRENELAEADRKREAAIDRLRPPNEKDIGQYSAYSAPRLTGASTNSGSTSVSGSQSYDYTGMDEAAKVSQALQAAQGSFIGVALSDPMKIPELQNSIRSMQQYLAAYQSGQGLPPVRISSNSSSASVSPGSRSASYGQKLLGTMVLSGKKKKEEQEQPAPAAPAAPPAQEPLVDVRGQVAGGPDNTQLVSDATFGIPSNVDTTVDPTQQKPGEVARRPGSSFSPRGKPQGPPMPGLQHSASLWDLDYYV